MTSTSHRSIAGAPLGSGNGPHACPGADLAKLEMQALLRAMVPRVRSMATGNPTRLRNTTLQGFSGLTARFNRWLAERTPVLTGPAPRSSA